MKNFDDLNLSPELMKSLAHMEYKTPTPIQAKAIPLALQGKDIMGSAQTGTGKTAAFAIPLIERLLTNPHGNALVLTPTRELGKQIMNIMHQLLGHKSPVKTAFIIGGESMGKQIGQLRAGPRLIVGTPGRINDHLDRGTMLLNETDFLVLDETDRMLDMGFSVQLERIFKHMPEQRQTLMFSATLPDNIIKMSKQYMNDPQRIAVGETNVVASNIKQEAIRIEQGNKYDVLKAELDKRDGSVIVFIKTKHGADRMAKNLRRDGYTSEALHGDLRQNKRDRVMQNFRKQNFRILIATDIAARGLDVPHIKHVINHDLPQVAEDFIHRMGRTARAGAQGSAISFVASHDVRMWREIEDLLYPDSAGKRTVKKKAAKRNSKKRGQKLGEHYEEFGTKGKNFRRPKKRGYNALSKDERKAAVQSKDSRTDDKSSDSFGKKPNKKSGKKFEKKQDRKFDKKSDKRSDNKFDKKSDKKFEKKFEKQAGSKSDLSASPKKVGKKAGKKKPFDKPYGKKSGKQGGKKFQSKSSGNSYQKRKAAK